MRPLGGIHDFLGTLIQDRVVVRLHPNANYLFLSCHVYSTPRDYRCIGPTRPHRPSSIGTTGQSLHSKFIRQKGKRQIVMDFLQAVNARWRRQIGQKTVALAQSEIACTMPFVLLMYQLSAGRLLGEPWFARSVPVG